MHPEAWIGPSRAQQPLPIERAHPLRFLSNHPCISSPFVVRFPGAQIVEYVFENIRAVEPQVINLSPAIADVIGKFVGMFPRPLLNEDRVREFGGGVARVRYSVAIYGQLLLFCDQSMREKAWRSRKRGT